MDVTCGWYTAGMDGQLICEHGISISRCEEKVSVVAFETNYENLPCQFAVELRSLEAHQGAYHFFVDRGVVWIPFRRDEVIRYAQGLKAFAHSTVWSQP